MPTDFENPVPNITEAKQLADPALFQQFETLVQKIIDKDDQEVALLGRRVLEDILLPQYPELQNGEPEIHERYQRLIVLLKFINLAVRGMPEITSLIENNLIVALQAGIPIKKKFQEVLNVYDDTLLSGTVSGSLIKALSNSTEKLGTAILLLKGKNQPAHPTLANWLSDYRISTLQPVGGGEQIATAFDRVTYIRQSPNVKKLSKDEQDVLLRVLEPYDWLRFGSALLRTGLEESATATAREPLYIKKERLVVPSPPKSPITPTPPVVWPKPPEKKEFGISNIEYGGKSSGILDTKYQIQDTKKRVLPTPPPPPKTEFRIQNLESRNETGREEEKGARIISEREVPFVTPPAPAKAKMEVSEDLYRKTLEELNKLRTEETTEPGKGFSVNEALVHAKKNLPFQEESPIFGEEPSSSSVMSGQASPPPAPKPSSGEQESVEEKLRKLKDKLQ